MLIIFLIIHLPVNTTICHIFMIFYKYIYFFFSFFFCKKESLNTKLKTEKELLNKEEVEVNNVKRSVREVTKRHLKKAEAATGGAL